MNNIHVIVRLFSIKLGFHLAEAACTAHLGVPLRSTSIAYLHAAYQHKQTMSLLLFS